MSARFGCVVLSRGRRPDTLKEGVESILRQVDVEVDVVVVGNGWQPDGLPPQVATLALEHNLGIPAGRNAGVPLVSGEFVLFLDDDASLPQDDALQQVARLLDRHPDIGLVQLHPVDPDGGPTPGRWIPRLRVGDEYRSSDICALWEGAIVARRDAFERSGGWPDCFFYMHEGIDLAWRVWTPATGSTSPATSSPTTRRRPAAPATTTGTTASTPATASGWPGATCRPPSVPPTSASGRRSASPGCATASTASSCCVGHSTG